MVTGHWQIDDLTPSGRPDPFALAADAAWSLAEVTGAQHHDAAVVLGTGLSGAAGPLGCTGDPIDISALPGFRPLRAPGHRSAVWSTSVAGLRVLVLAGRAHLYEGLSAAAVVHPVRVAAAAGCRTVVLTASAGSLRPDVGPGRLALIGDHLNLTARSPLTGIHAGGATPSPFVDLTTVWSAHLRTLARRLDPALPELVYAQLPGPHLETPAEIRMLGVLGADLVGMSTALEAIAAHHLGAAVLGIAVVGNAAAGMSDGPLDLSRIHAGSALAADAVGALIAGVLAASARPTAIPEISTAASADDRVEHDAAPLAERARARQRLQQPL